MARSIELHTTQGLPPEIAEFAGPWFESMNREIVQKAKTHEELFVELDVQAGDRVRLTELNPGPFFGEARRRSKEDGATLEGVVRRVKRGRKDGKWKIQIDGFAVAGNNVFWLIDNYQVEVLHRVYRMTPEDRVIMELSGISETVWKKKSEPAREWCRQQFGGRAKRIRNILVGEQ